MHIITKLELGGAQKSALSLLGHLDKNRYNLSLISSNKGILIPEARNISGLNVFLLPTLKRAVDPIKDLLTLMCLIRLIKSNKYDLVHTHSSKAGILGRWAAKFANVPVILHTVHGWGFHQRQTLLVRRIFIFLERITARITSKIIAVSASDIKQGLAAGIGKQNQYTLIRYGIPQAEFTHCSVDIQKKKEELGFKANSKIVGMVACFKPQKAPEDFLKAVSLVKKQHPGTKFILVGDGVLRSKLEDLRRRLSLEQDLLFTGWRRDIAEIMSILDVFTLSSLWEGLPIVLLEAMASSLPIVVTATGGAQELVNNGVNGFLVSPRDVQELAQKINLILANKTLADKMGQAGKKMLDSTFATEYMAGRIDNLYQTIRKAGNLC